MVLRALKTLWRMYKNFNRRRSFSCFNCIFIFLRVLAFDRYYRLTLPVALLGTLFFLYLFGLTLNTMTLMALFISRAVDR